jgi:hypothetical protein
MQIHADTTIIEAARRLAPVIRAHHPAFTPGSYYQGPLYRFPFIGVAASALPPVLLAVAPQALEEVSALAQGKVPVAASTLLRERASAQAKLAQAEALLRAGRVLLYDTLSEAWEATVKCTV